MKKRILSLLLALLMLPTLFACTETPHESQSEQESESQSEQESTNETEEIEMKDIDVSLKDAEESLLLLGRAHYGESALVCDNVGDGIAFRLRFNGELIVTGSCDRDTYFTVYMDGTRLDTRAYFYEGESSVVIAENDDDEIHEIRMVSQNEAQFSLTTLDAIAFYGVLEEPPAAREYYIEFIGDSLLTGYGNLVPAGTPDVERSVYQDGTQAFPFMTAEALGVDVAVTGCSGIGVTVGWRDFTMDKFFPAASYYRDAETEYEYPRVPDLVVLSLGTNDVYAPSNAVNMTNPDDVDRLTAGFTALITQIEEYYDAGIPVILVCGVATSKLNQFAPALMQSLGGEDAGMYFIQMPGMGSGGGGHPSVTEHERITNALVAFIREKKILE